MTSRILIAGKLLALLALLAGTLGFQPSRPVLADTYFPQTGYSVWGPFEAYWNAHGGLAQFGLPRTGVYPAGDGYDAQWFERALFTYNPKNPDTYKVELNLLGNDITASRRTEAPFQRAKPSGEGQYFDPTGHNLSGKFLDYWNAAGGLPIYGYPISEPFMEKSKSDGKTYLVQYFERNRFELHPELAGTRFEVQLGLLGSELLDTRGGPQAFTNLGAPTYYPPPTGTGVPSGGIVDSPNAGTPVPGGGATQAPALPATTRQILFQDNFSDPALTGWQPTALLDPPGAQPAAWATSAGMLWQSQDSRETGASDEAILLSKGRSYSDLKLEVYFYATSAEAVGVMLRVGDSGAYLIKLYPSAPNDSPKASLLKVAGGVSTIAASSQAWAGYQRGSWHLLSVMAVGQSLTAFVDSQLALQAGDSTSTEGAFGLYTYADGTTRFDYVRVTAP